MDESRFDRLARLLAATAERRAWLGAALVLGLFIIGHEEDGAARRRRRREREEPANDPQRRGLAAERKKKRKKKKCKPGCVGRVCGDNGCKGKKAGICGTCAAGTTCNAAGQCVGCLSGGECAPRVCNEAACADGACVYTPVGSDAACPPPRRCLAGQCVGCLSGSDCAPRACNRESCQNETCTYTPDADGGSCGGPDEICCGGNCVNRAGDDGQCACTSACSGSDTCQNGVCCTVCASGCPFSDFNAALNAAAVGATVRLCPGTYVVQRLFNKDVTLVGMGATLEATVLSHPSGQIVQVARGTTVTLRNLQVTGGTPVARASAIFNEGDLTLRDVKVNGNTLNTGTSTVGGGIVNASFDRSPRLTLIDSVVGPLNVANRGGGIFNDATTTLIRSTVEANVAVTGGGVYNTGTLNLTEGSRIRSNQSGGGASSGAGVYNDRGSVVVNSGSSILGNSPDNCVNANGGTGCPA